MIAHGRWEEVWCDANYGTNVGDMARVSEVTVNGGLDYGTKWVGLGGFTERTVRLGSGFRNEVGG